MACQSVFRQAHDVNPQYQSHDTGVSLPRSFQQQAESSGPEEEQTTAAERIRDDERSFKQQGLC